MYSVIGVELLLRVLKRPVKLTEVMKAKSAGILWTNEKGDDVCYDGERLAIYKNGEFFEGDEAYFVVGGKNGLIAPGNSEIVCEEYIGKSGVITREPLGERLGDWYDWASERNIKLWMVIYGYYPEAKEFYEQEYVRVNQTMESYQDYLSLMDSKFKVLIDDKDI